MFLLATFLLVTGSPFLMFPILKSPDILLGSLSTALGIIALPTMLFAKLHLNPSIKDKTKRLLLIITKMGVALSTLWWPLGRYLSGNWNNSFHYIPERSALFWALTYALVGYLLLLWFIYAVNLMLTRKKSN